MNSISVTRNAGINSHAKPLRRVAAPVVPFVRADIFSVERTKKIVRKTVLNISEIIITLLIE